MLAVMLPSASPRDLSNQRLLNRLHRAASRAALNNPRIAGLHPAPPVITDNGATSPAITAANPYGCNAASRGVWHVIGGRYGSGGRISAAVQDAMPTDINTYARWEVMADSRYFTARLGPTTVPYRFIIDGRYVSTTGTVLATTTGNTDQYVLLDFGTRAVRRIVVEAMRTGRLAGGLVEDGAALWPVDTSDVPHGVFLGDSYVFGSGPDLTADGVAVQMADRLGLALQASGSGGTGWNQTATSSHRFDQRIANGDLGLAYQPPEIIFLHASVNDAYAGQNTATLQANALAGLRSARAQYPGVPIVVFGCIAAPNRAAAMVSAVEASVAAAVAAFADPLCRFVPVDGDPSGKWVSGLGSELRFTGALSAATSATLTAAWPAGTSATSYTILFSDGSSRIANLTQNATTVSWSGAVTAGATAMVRQTEGNARFTMSADWIHPSNYGAAYLGERYARSALSALEGDARMNGAAGRDGAERSAGGSGPLLRVAVVYHVWPHYRQPVMQAMDRSRVIAYDFYGSGEALEGVLHAQTSSVMRFVRAPFRRFGKLLWQSGAVQAARDGRYQAIILLADPNFASTWVAATLARLRGVPVLFWGHGWLRPESAVKKAVRRKYFALSQRFLVYAERGKQLGVEAGFPAERITVIYNSLDVARADAVIATIESGTPGYARPQALFADPERPLLICTARLTAKCRFDLLLTAAATLSHQGFPVNVLLVGDGPERAALERQADELGVAVHFFGACHDEEVVGPLLYHADLTVSPGKIGLTAMHSLMYGTPAITHGDFDAQMPEVEAIEPGCTGAFFRCDDAADLARAIAHWLDVGPPREQVRASARATIRAKWTPEVQAHLIEQAVLQVAGHA